MIKATAMVQIIGRPKEHIEKVITDVTEKIPEQGYETERVEIMPVEPLEDSDEYFSGLFEVDLKLKDHEQLFGFIQDFNPLSLEVSEPDEFEMTLADYNSLVSTVTGTVQQYDQLIKEKIGENASLKRTLDALTRNIIVLSVASGPKKAGRIKTETGLGEDTIRTYLAALIKNGTIEKHADTFRLATNKSADASE